MQYLLQLIAMCLADADRLAAEPGREAADRLARQHLAAGETRAGGEPVAHRVGDQFGPTLAPQIAGDLGAVGVGDQTTDFLRPWRDAAVHFAGAKHDVPGAVLASAAMDVTGLRQIDRDAAGDAAERLAPANDAGNGLLIHAVLQRHDIAVRRQILPDQHGGPGGIVGFHTDEGDIDRRLPGQLLRVGDVQRAHGNGEFRYIHGVGDAQAVFAHMLDMLGPWIDEGHVLARLHHMGAGISPDGTGSDDRDFLAHAFPLRFILSFCLQLFLAAKLAHRPACSQWLNRVRKLIAAMKSAA